MAYENKPWYSAKRTEPVKHIHGRWRKREEQDEKGPGAVIEEY